MPINNFTSLLVHLIYTILIRMAHKLPDASVSIQNLRFSTPLNLSFKMPFSAFVSPCH